MVRFHHFALASFVTLSVGASCLVACSGPGPTPPAASLPAVPRERLSHLVERYWDENAAANPWYSWSGAESYYGEAGGDAISPQALADALAIERRYLADVHDLSPAPLDRESQLTYELFRRERELAIEGLTYPAELMPVNPYDSVPQRFALAAIAAEGRALSSDQEFDGWRRRAENYVSWTNQAVDNMRDGMRRGYTLPRELVERMLPQLAALGDDAQTNLFYRGSASANGDGAETERRRRTLALDDEIKEKILPAYRLLHDFLQHEYLPRSRDAVGLAVLPLGDAWYAYLVKRTTGGTLTPAALLAMGLSEVERLHGRIQTVLAETAFAGNPRGFFDDIRHDPRWSYKNAEELLAAYQAMKPQAADAMPTLFSAMPRADLEIRSVEAFREATSPALFYRAATADGKSAAVLYVNGADVEARPATDVAAQFLREGLPGHHYQLSLQQERADLPRFRRFGGSSAFIEGWGLYAASLGEEMGIYRDSAAKFGSLLAQLDCAALMVVDTGVHAKGWSRQQAVEFLHGQIPLDDTTVANEVDRTIAFPAESLACTVGFLNIQALRARAQQALGERFDVRAFHAAVLRDGAIPLDLLDAKMKQWLQRSVAEPPAITAPAASVAAPPATAPPPARDPPSGDTS